MGSYLHGLDKNFLFWPRDFFSWKGNRIFIQITLICTFYQFTHQTILKEVLSQYLQSDSLNLKSIQTVIIRSRQNSMSQSHQQNYSVKFTSNYYALQQYPHEPQQQAVVHSSSQQINILIEKNIKALTMQKNRIRKLMISCILSSLYIEQYNYLQAHKILTDMQKIIAKVQQMTTKMRIPWQDECELAIIKIKMYTNLIFIEIINNQEKYFTEHLHQALDFISSFKGRSQKIKKNLLPADEQDSQNSNPNTVNSRNSQKSKALNLMVHLFQLFLKGFTGFQCFQQIQAETLLAECNKDKQTFNQLKNFFYFSKISILKLLTTSDFEGAYKIQLKAYNLVQKDIEKSKKQKNSISLKQVILKTVCLRKLLYLSEKLQLPQSTRKGYQQKLMSSQSFESKYLKGIHEKTVFRNFEQKINLVFDLIKELKKFQKGQIFPILLDKQAKQYEQGSDSQNGLKLWQYRALKNKFLKIIGSQLLREDNRAKQNIFMVIQCLDRAIERSKSSGYISRLSSLKVPVEEELLLQNIGFSKKKQLFKDQINKNQNVSLYESAISQYKNRIEVLCYSLSSIFFNPILENALDHIQLYKPLKKVQNQSLNKQQEQEQEQDDDLEINVDQVQIIDQNHKKQHNLNQDKLQRQKIIRKEKNSNLEENKSISLKQHEYKVKPLKRQQIIGKTFNDQQQLTYSNEYGDATTPSKFITEFQNYDDKSKRIQMKNIYLNDKSQLSMDYAEIGSRVKLNQTKIPSISPKNRQKVLKNQTKQVYFNQSIKKEEGLAEIPNEESIVKYLGRKYPFEEKIEENHTPLSHYTKQNQSKFSYDETDTFSLQNFKKQRKVNVHSKVIQNRPQGSRFTEDQSNSKSKNKKSSVSPKIPKDTVINSRLNEHVKKHQMSYSPERSQNEKQKQANQNSFIQKSDPSQGLSKKSKSKNKPKVEKAGIYSKSPSHSSHINQNKTIKFREFMQNLEKSGIKLSKQQSLTVTQQEAKIEQGFGHRRNATQSSQLNQNTLDQYMGEVKSKLQSQQGRSNSILQNYFTINPSQKPRRQERRDSQSNGSSPEQQRKTSHFKQHSLQHIKHTQSSEIKVTQHNIKQKSSPSKSPNTKSKSNLSVNGKGPSSIAQSKHKTKNSQNLSPTLINEYILKMTKNHKHKLNYLIKLCQNGQYIDKKHYSSDGGDERFLQLSSDHKYLEWAVSQNKLIEGHKKKYEIKYIKGVVFGKVTETMTKSYNKHLQPYKCISLIFQKRTFDIYIPDEQDSKFWLPGISFYVCQAKPQLNHPNYTTKIQKFIKTRIKPIELDEWHSASGYYSLGRVLWKKALLKMQHLYLTKDKMKKYHYTNAGAIIEFKKAIDKEVIKKTSLLPPTGKQSKISRQKSSNKTSKLRV